MLSREQGDGFARVARALAARATALTGADGVIVGITDGPAVHFRFGVGVFEGSDFEASLLVPPARALLEGRGMRGGAEEDVSPGVRAEIERLGIRSVISVPVMTGPRQCGVMTAVRCRDLPFDAAALGALTDLASLVGDAIESAWALRTAYGWLTLESAPIGMAVSAVDGTFLEVNRAFASCLGWDSHELVGRSFRSIIHDDDVAGSQLRLDQAIADGSMAFRMEQRCCRPDGSVVWADFSVTVVRSPAGEAQQLISQVVDVTERVEAKRLLAHRASHDRLTGLPNRARFTELVVAAATNARRGGTTLAVLFLNLDRFKVVNESIGHDGGDDVLCEVAERLRVAAGSGKTVARFGGDCFAILCEDVKDQEEARWMASHLLTTLQQPVVVGGREIRAAASVGVAVGGAGRPVPAAALLREADAACSLGKARGGGTIAMFDEALRHRAHERLDVEAALLHAVSRHELRLLYQPVVELRTGHLAGVEALLRWEHPTLGLLAPDGFIQVAEESGLVVEMGQWVLAAAAEQMGAWRQRWPALSAVSMGINVAARQLVDPRFPGYVARARELAGAGAPLCLEVTETELLASATAAQAVLANLRSDGVRVALDDLGTGYASLAYVAGLEADVLKVDRTFTAGLGQHATHAAVVAAVVSLGHSLGHTVVAEGVETAEQARLLDELGCDLAQGYLCGRPADPDELAPMLEQAAAGSPIFRF